MMFLGPQSFGGAFAGMTSWCGGRCVNVRRQSLAIAIVLSGIALSAFHYELKPKPSEKDLQDMAHGMSSRIKWRGQIAPKWDGPSHSCLGKTALCLLA